MACRIFEGRIPEFLIARLPLILVFLCACGARGMAQDSGRAPLPAAAQAAPQNQTTITAVPNRPTFSTTAETVQTGVFEVEYGLEAAAGHQNINGLLKLGLVKNLELRFANNPVERDGGTAALGDSAVGFKYRFTKDGGVLPTLSFLYTATLPTAGDGLGASALNHSVGILVSKDFGKHHVDFNENAEWRGRPEGGGFDRDYFTAFAYSYRVTVKVGFAAEVAGFSRVNAAIPPTVTVLQALTYNVSTRLILDGGCYVAARGDLPRVTFFAGLTYAVADLSRHFRFTHH